MVIFIKAVYADSFNEKCPDIQTCVKVVGEMLGQKYMFAEDIKGKVQATQNLELTRENAEWLFTYMLNLEGYTRVPLGLPNSFQVLRQRDAKDAALPLYEATAKKQPELPHNWDWFTVRYKATNPEAVEQISRVVRNFMPPNTRVIPNELSGTLLITDSVPNLKKIYNIIKDLDQKPSVQMQKKWEEEAKRKKAELSNKMSEEVLAKPVQTIQQAKQSN